MTKTPTFDELSAQKLEIEKQIAAALLPPLQTVLDRLNMDDVTELAAEFAKLQQALPAGSEDATQVGHLGTVINGLRVYFEARARDLNELVNPYSPVSPTP